ncbi:hypothetical protein WMY93_030952 [Mugilogobius chulae]|uniref:Uncharacterized protein n=1 Tax=Mugilogobius chulae TaxID=88201 RepID=A0AAW0MK79_9GOBI
MQTPQSTEALSSAPEPEAAPETSLEVELTPSSRGRQRKKNPKYEDYQVSEVYDGQTSPRKRPRRTSAKVQSHPAADGEEDDAEEENVPKKTPKKRGRPPGKKTPGRKTPGKTTAAAGQEASGQNGEGPTENETPKPKRQYKKRKREEEIKEEVKEAKEREEEKEDEESEETTGGRPKRGAARAALKYLHSLAKAELQTSYGGPNQANGDDERPQRDPALNQRTARASGDDDKGEDEDFVPNVEEAEEEDPDEEDPDEEEEEEDDMFEVFEQSSASRHSASQTK